PPFMAEASKHRRPTANSGRLGPPLRAKTSSDYDEFRSSGDESDSHATRRWREVDSNHRFLVRRSRFLLRRANCGGLNGGGLLKLFFLGGTAGLNPHTP